MHDDNARQRTINSWNDTLRADKRHHLEYTQRSQTLPFFFLPLYLPGSHPSVHLVAFWPSCFSVLAPLVRSVGPFLLRSGPISGSSFPACPPFYLCCSLGSSWPLVHLSSGRCIGVSLSLVNDTILVFVLVCLSVDVTGALVLLNSFCFACLLLLLAPPPFCPFVTSPYSSPA